MQIESVLKTGCSISLFILLAGCQPASEKSSGCNISTKVCSSSSPLKPSPGDDEVPEFGVPANAMTFETNLVLENFDADQEHKVLKAADYIREVVASEKFKDAILNHTYKGVKTFVDAQGLSNAQIYNKFLQGAEMLLPSKNNAMDVELELYFENTTTIGYTYPDTERIWMNTKFFNSYTPAQVAGNLTHEWMHKLGFTHSMNPNSARPYSVPYAVGHLMAKLISEL